MLFKGKHHQSQILPVVITGFTIILVAIAASWSISTRQMDDLTDAITQSRLTTKKMDIVALMTEVSRTRAHLTMQMVYNDDVFERDEINMSLNSKATDFVVLRNKLIAAGLTQKERELLNRQTGYIKNSQAYLSRAVDLALSDSDEDRRLAGEYVINKVYPEQGKVVDHFMALLELQKSELDVASETSLANLEKNNRFNQIMVSVVLIGSFGIILFMVKNIRGIENQLIHEKEKAQVTLSSIGDGVITVNKRGEVEYLNQVAIDILGQNPSKLLGCNINNLFKTEVEGSDKSIWKYIQDVIHSDHVVNESSNIRLGLKDRSSMILKANISPIGNLAKGVNDVVISFHDITESEALMNKIQHQASHDALTGLYNRRAFEEKVNQMLKLYDEDTNHAFCIMDLDQFKYVNDSAGHAAGDELLRQLAKTIKPVIRKSDLISRLGGDEFGVFLSNVSPENAVAVAEKILTAVQTFGFYWEDNVYRVGASIGMVNVSEDIIDYEYLYRAADSACYMAKNEGRNRIHLLPLDAELMEKKAQESEYLQHLTKTLETEQFYLFAQNIIPISPRVAGRKHVEILLRMKDSQGELIPPMAFIPIAERYGLMANIDLWVLQKVCDHINEDPLDNTVYAVNLSGQSLSSRDHMQEMESVIVQRKIPPGRLCLEITETVAIANLEIASRFMHMLRDYGCYTALDDFGSGLSSFSYLKNLPLDYIKIDGVFVKSVTDDQASSVMIEAIHTIGNKLGMLTIAEYVEDEAAVSKLKQIGIDMAQGYYFDKPQVLIEPS